MLVVAWGLARFLFFLSSSLFSEERRGQPVPGASPPSSQM